MYASLKGKDYVEVQVTWGDSYYVTSSIASRKNYIFECVF